MGESQENSLPARYTFKSHVSCYQQLIIWPARTMQVAWHNDCGAGLVHA